MFNAIALFPTMRDMHYRESRDGFYNSWMFLVSHALLLLRKVIIKRYCSFAKLISRVTAPSQSYLTSNSSS